MNAGDTYLDGKVVIVRVDSQGRALEVRFPTLQDEVGQEQTVTFAFGQVLDGVLAIAHALGL